MKLLWLTDLHLDKADEAKQQELFGDLRGRDADAAVITGDISDARGLPGHLRELGRALAPRPVYFVLGNHDFYGSSFADADRAVAGLVAEQPNLRHLGQGEVVGLTCDNALVGHRGWADGRAGWGILSGLHNRDREAIADMRGLSDRAAFDLMGVLGRTSAAYFREILPYALACYQRVFVATHAPVVEQAAIYCGRRCGPRHLPHYVNRSAGAALAGIAKYYPKNRITVLCGHTHSAARAKAGANVEVLVGPPGVAGCIGAESSRRNCSREPFCP